MFNLANMTSTVNGANSSSLCTYLPFVESWTWHVVIVKTTIITATRIPHVILHGNGTIETSYSTLPNAIPSSQDTAYFTGPVPTGVVSGLTL